MIFFVISKSFFANIIPKAIKSILWAVYIQLAISFVYIPILIYWGLPISYMSVIGNLIFAPFLFLFIFLSFIIFSTEILMIPNNFLCTLLNYFSALWIKILALGSPKWLIGFACPGIFWLAIFTISGIIVIWMLRTTKIFIRIIILLCVLTSQLAILKYAQLLPKKHIIIYRQTPINITNNNNILTMSITHTTFYEKNFKQWFLRSMQPELYKTFGHAKIQKIVLINPTKHTKKIIESHKEIIGYQDLVLVFD